jgi:trans-aconitate methyltransferase
MIHFPVLGVGVDTNEQCVRVARSRGLTAFTPAEFERSVEFHRPERFDSILFAHVAEHMTEDQTVTLLMHYLPLLRPDGCLIVLAPQEAGFKSDATHVQFMDFARLTRIAERLGLSPERTFSFPFPRWAGSLFTYNEFVVVSRKPAGRSGTDRRA